MSFLLYSLYTFHGFFEAKEEENCGKGYGAGIGNRLCKIDRKGFVLEKHG